jgi:hypothetical protein
VWDWAKDNPEISIPSAVVGIPVAVAAAPMIASYVLFPFVSVASGLMPEFSSEMAGVFELKTLVLYYTIFIMALLDLQIIW